MGSSKKILINSGWMIIQPLILNIISIAAIGYIARSLGQVDYGKFVFAFAFINMFLPLTNIGLRTITVRRLASDKSDVEVYIGKILVLRVLISFVVIISIVLLVNILGYPGLTKTIVYIASSLILFQAISTTFYDVFQSFEEMKYVALVQFWSGLILTILSVAVLYAGFGLIGLAIIYAFGNFLGMILSIWVQFRKYAIPKLKYDFAFCLQNIKNGLPFFLPFLASMLSGRLGIIILSKYAGDSSVGIYGAATNLVEKLTIIPDGICTAVFPAIASLYQKSSVEAGLLFKKYYFYLFLMGLPIATGTTILARPIIILIYGPEYESSVYVLQILVWWLFLFFLTMIQSWTLGAAHKEKNSASVVYVASFISIIAAFIFIPRFGAIGAAIVLVANNSILFCLYFLLTRKLFASSMEIFLYAKAVAAALIMAAGVYWLRDQNLFMSIFSGIISYIAALFMFKIINMNDIEKIWSITKKKQESAKKLDIENGHNAKY